MAFILSSWASKCILCVLNFCPMLFFPGDPRISSGFYNRKLSGLLLRIFWNEGKSVTAWLGCPQTAAVCACRNLLVQAGSHSDCDLLSDAGSCARVLELELLFPNKVLHFAPSSAEADSSLRFSSFFSFLWRLTNLLTQINLCPIVFVCLVTFLEVDLKPIT